MTRLSTRISAAITRVKCPGCGKSVVPEQPPSEPTPPTPSAGKARWSFIWLPPSGQVCPECSFPLERYARRQRWFRLFTVGVAILTISLVWFVLTLLGGMGPVPIAVVTLAVVGFVAFVTGLVGIVVGSRHARE